MEILNEENHKLKTEIREIKELLGANERNEANGRDKGNLKALLRSYIDNHMQSIEQQERGKLNLAEGGR